MPAPRAKICGITRFEDAHHAVEAGAWALGMIFWEGSPRRCEVAEAQRIGASLRRRVELAGVFVDATLDEVAAVAEAVPLSLVQLHGDEGPSFAIEVARRTGAKVIKARRVRSKGDVDDLARFHVEYHLVDTPGPLPGGSGKPFDHSLLRRRRSNVSLILAGGLTPENVGEAIGRVQPWGVDVATGTEAAPGIKDPGKVERFIAAVRATAEDEAA